MATSRKRITRCTLIAACLWTAGCANLDSFPPGTPAAAIESSRGKPYRVWPEANGESSWEYPQGPAGRYTHMVRVGADGRVTRVDQVLDWPTFALLRPGMPIREVEHALGRPYSKTYMPLLDENVWAWRWVEAVWNRCFYAHFAPDGTLRRTSVGNEEVADIGIHSARPC
jgi:hypothetical protein